MNSYEQLSGPERKRLFEAGEVLKTNSDLLSVVQERIGAKELPPSGDSRSAEREWPAPLAPQALYGAAGELVRAILPHTEADPAALLFQFLAGFGNLVGRNPHTIVDGARHGSNLFAAVVGVSSKGRKGTAWSHIRRQLELVDHGWTAERVQSGLSSGEGLVWGVRDAIEKQEPIREHGRIVEYQTLIADQGVADKRLMIIEQELAATLRVMARDGSTLSTTIRQAWDTGDLRILTKCNPAQATGAHVSIVGHITRDELRRFLNSTEMANGFANRFLWVCAKRSKLLPEGGNIQAVDFQPVVQKLIAAVQFSRDVGEVKRDCDAREIWREVYPMLSEGKPGLLGTVTGRSEAQVLRLSLLYALLDCSHTISPSHMLAALAAWDYCEASARFIFGDLTGDPIADRILGALRSQPDGLSRTGIRDLFGRNQHEPAIGAALAALEERGLARRDMLPTNGRPIESWTAVLPDTTKTT